MKPNSLVPRTPPGNKTLGGQTCADQHPRAQITALLLLALRGAVAEKQSEFNDCYPPFLASILFHLFLIHPSLVCSLF